MLVKIAPSILSADFSRLREQVAAVEEAGVEYLHIDVMDGHFVPNITIGPPVVASLRPHSRLVFDVHLMIEKPDYYIEEFIAAGADLVTVHVEACTHLHRTVTRIKEKGALAGIALNPATPLALVEPILPTVDLVLLMTVNPGFGGQRFIGEIVSKLEALCDLRAKYALKFEIEVDGGINVNTAPAVVRAGAGVLVTGSAIFTAPDIATAIHDLRAAAHSTLVCIKT